VVARTLVGLRRRDALVAGLCTLSSVALASTLVEATTDRDWAVRGWEWPEVIAAASVVTLGSLWLVSLRHSPSSLEPGGLVRQLVKAEIRHRGYTLQRLPSSAFDPRLALTVDFEYVLAHYLASRWGPRPFFFLQVGAHDGAMEDPLRNHVLGGQWHGILVEPQALPFGRLVENYAGLDGLTFINAAVSERSGQKTLYVIQDETGATLESLSGTASFRRETLEAPHRKVGPAGSRIGSVEVVCKTFADVLADVAYLDLLEIDAEGYDLELLKLFDFGRIKPPIVRFEHRHLSPDERDEAVELLADHGYRMVREEYDTTAYSAPSIAR
jgi:FkbM family methyltransferase